MIEVNIAISEMREAPSEFESCMRYKETENLAEKMAMLWELVRVQHTIMESMGFANEIKTIEYHDTKDL